MQHHHGRAGRHTSEQLEHVFIVHADAAVRDEAADRGAIVGAMDGIFAATQPHRRGPHRIIWCAPGNDIRQPWIFALDIRRWRPGRLDILALDIRAAGPRLSGPADTDRITPRGPHADHVIETTFAGVDDDGADGIAVEEHNVM